MMNAGPAVDLRMFARAFAGSIVSVGGAITLESQAIAFHLNVRESGMAAG